MDGLRSPVDRAGSLAYPPNVDPMNWRHWLVAVAVCVALCGSAWWEVDRLTRSHALTVDAMHQAERDSIAAHYTAMHIRDSVMLSQWRDSVTSMPRDTLVRRVVRYISAHDTTWTDTGATDTIEVVRWLAVSDSAQRVRVDSLSGELDQCVYDLNEAISRNEVPARWSWSAFGLGVGVGAASAASACILSQIP